MTGMTEEQTAKIMDEFYTLAEELNAAGKWNEELQEVMDDLSTGCDPQTCLDDLRKKSED